LVAQIVQMPVEPAADCAERGRRPGAFAGEEGSSAAQFSNRSKPMRTKTLASLLFLCGSTAAVAQMQAAPALQDAPNATANMLMDEPLAEDPALDPLANQTGEPMPDAPLPGDDLDQPPLDPATPDPVLDEEVSDPTTIGPVMPEPMGDDAPPTR